MTLPKENKGPRNTNQNIVKQREALESDIHKLQCRIGDALDYYYKLKKKYGLLPGWHRTESDLFFASMWLEEPLQQEVEFNNKSKQEMTLSGESDRPCNTYQEIMERNVDLEKDILELQRRSMSLYGCVDEIYNRHSDSPDWDSIEELVLSYAQDPEEWEKILPED